MLLIWNSRVAWIWQYWLLAIDFRQLPKVMSPCILISLPHWNWALGNCRKSIAKSQYCHIHVSRIADVSARNFQLYTKKFPPSATKYKTTNEIQLLPRENASNNFIISKLSSPERNFLNYGSKRCRVRRCSTNEEEYFELLLKSSLISFDSYWIINFIGQTFESVSLIILMRPFYSIATEVHIFANTGKFSLRGS
jgi:hypothetical protein